jgi:hypothetical protein
MSGNKSYPSPSDQPKQHERWATLLTFLTHWGRPLTMSDGVSMTEIEMAEQNLAFRLPSALREWMILSGKRSSNKVSQTNYLRLPEQLKVRDRLLVFYVENQGTVAWGLKQETLFLDDPPVWIDASDINVGGLGWIKENNSVSQFIFQMELMDTVAYTEPYVSRQCDGEIANKIRKSFDSFDLPSWHWPIYPTDFYKGRDVLIELHNDSSFVMAGRTQTAISQALELLDLSK